MSWENILKQYTAEFQLFSNPDKVRYRRKHDVDARDENEIEKEIEEMKEYAEQFFEDIVNMFGYGNSYHYRDAGQTAVEFTNELWDMTLAIVINNNIVATRKVDVDWVVNFGEQ